jgi:hypothetical protein
MRYVIILLAVLAICYLLLIGTPKSPQEIQFAQFFSAMKFEVGDLIDHFSLMQNPAVKLIILLGAALILIGFTRQVLR